MTNHRPDPIQKLLQRALPPVDPSAEPASDLWAVLQSRLGEAVTSAAAPVAGQSAAFPWFDVALAAGLVGLVAFFPAAIPMLLYYL
jgi:hypothetical protein